MGSVGRVDQMNVPYDQWGEEIRIQQVGDNVYIEDFNRYNQVEDIRPVTKKEVLADIDGWRNDDGTYGDEDVSIFIAYADGSYVTEDDLTGKPYKRRNIIGASISTADYEMVWGNEVHQGREVPIQTWSIDGESGLTNSYSGYKATETWKVRQRITFYRDKNGNVRRRYETIRQSTRKSI